MLQRAASPLGISVAQRRAQLAESNAKSAMSSVSHVTKETHCVRDVAKAAIAKAKSVHGEVESRVATLVAQAEANTKHVVDRLSKRVSVVVVQSEAQTSRVVGTVAQQLEKGIEASALSAAATSEHNTCIAIDNVRTEVQAQLKQNRVDLEQ